MALQVQHIENPALSTIAIVGEGLALWEQLSSKRQAVRQPRGLPDLDLPSTKASLRSTCRALRDLSYPLITELESLVLGSCLALHASSDFSDDADAWSSSQHAQQEHVKAFLARLHRLHSISVQLGQGGASQLRQLLEQGHLPRSLQSINIVAR